MEFSWLDRTSLLLGPQALDNLSTSHVMICGLGGVGSWAAEFICRAGIGEMTIVDNDIVKETNRNRQLPALKSTEGKPKADVLAQRLLDINPDLKLHVKIVFLKDDLIPQLIDSCNPNYIVDAIDTLAPKVFLIHYAFTHNYNIISSLGAGGRLDPSKIQVADISKSKNCRLAFYLRKRLRKLGVEKGVKVVFSTELVDSDAVIAVNDEENKKTTVGTISYIPAAFGVFCASAVITDLLKITK